MNSTSIHPNSGPIYEQVAVDFPDARPETLALKGFRDPVVGYRLGEGVGVPEQAQTRRLRGVIPRMSLGSAIFALLGAPCAAGSLVGPLAMGLGVGTVFGAMATYWAILDKPMFQYPLFALAILGSLANLYTLWVRRVTA